MNIPTRLLVLQRLQALLESTPLTVNGTAVDLDGHVFRGRNILGEESPSDDGFTLAIVEAPRPDVAVYGGDEGSFRSDSWTLLIQGTCPDDKLNPSDTAYYFYAAVEERLSQIIATKPGRGTGQYPEHFLLGDLVTSMEIAPPVVRPPGDKLAAKAFFFLPIRLGIATKLGEPYTSVV